MSRTGASYNMARIATSALRLPSLTRSAIFSVLPVSLRYKTAIVMSGYHPLLIRQLIVAIVVWTTSFTLPFTAIPFRYATTLVLLASSRG